MNLSNFFFNEKKTSVMTTTRVTLSFIFSDKFEEDTLIMPPITFFASEMTRDKEWDSIAAVHSGLVMTTTWSFDKCRMGDLKIVPEKFQNKNRTDFVSEAVCLCLTHCGNFVVIGKFKLVELGLR